MATLTMTEQSLAADGRRSAIVSATSQIWDLVVIGGGNAALCAAMSARETTAKVLVIERAPMALRGGNTRHTRNIRCTHSGSEHSGGAGYTFDELWSDLSGVGLDPANARLAGLTIAESQSVPAWMVRHGVRWQPPLSGTLQLARTNQFFLGGGKALINTYHRALQRMGIDVLYECVATDLLIDGRECRGVVVEAGGHAYEIRARAVVCASGGFEANIEWLRRLFGDAADNFIIRGAAYNDGAVLDVLLKLGAATAGEEGGYHAVALDARSPRFDGGIVTRLDMIPFAIVLNERAERFYDEGSDIWPKRYAIWGKKIAEQPDQMAYALWDSKITGLFIPPLYGAFTADSVGGLARELGLPVERTIAAVSQFNADVQPGQFDPTRLDGCSTRGLAPEKTNWAQPLDRPPYFGVPMRPGITFTYMGVAVDEDARVQRHDGLAFDNVFAAGEIMSGNVLSTGYLAGFGMTIGTVWGRIAGRSAGEYVRLG